MKTLLSYLAVAALIFTSSFTVNQQQQLNEQKSISSCFSSFRVHRQGKAGVSLNWTVGVAGISKFVVERSYDGEFFDPVNPVNFNGSSSYKYQDNDIYPGMIYYRITAVHSDGTTECSPVEMIRIVQRG
jgi:hypothetical protein